MGFFNHFFPGPGPGWPYTNLQQINLDWILHTTKDSNMKATDAQEKANRAIEYVEHFNDIVDQAVNEELPVAIDNAIQNGDFDELIQTAQNRRFVFISDSYGEGLTPDGTNESFITLLKNHLVNNNNDFFGYAQSGLKFFAPEDDHWAVDTLIKSHLNDIVKKETITDFVIALGYNDRNFSLEQDITDGIVRTNRVIKNNFTNPNLRIHLFALGYNCIDESIRGKLSYIYRKIYARAIGWNFYNMIPAICYSSLFSSDGFHPNQDGQNQITKQMLPMLNGGHTMGTAVAEETLSLSNGNTGLFTVLHEDFMTATITGSYMHYDDAITLNATEYHDIAEIPSYLPLTAPHSTSDIKRYSTPAVIKYTDDNVVKYAQVTMDYYFTQTARNVFKMKARIFALNSYEEPYLSINTVSDIYFPSNTIQMIIPY